MARTPSPARETRALPRHYFLEFLGGNSRMNDQETSAISPVSYSTLKCERNFLGDAHPLWNRYPGYLVCLFDRCMRFQKGKSIVGLDIERVFSIQITRVFHGRILRLPKWLFCGENSFHNRPSLFSSSTTLINFRLGIQASIPRIRSMSSRPRNRSFASYMNLSRSVIANEPLDTISTTSNLAHSLRLFGARIDCRS